MDKLNWKDLNKNTENSVYLNEFQEVNIGNGHQDF